MASEIAAEMRAIYNMRVADGQTAIFTHCLSPHVAIVRQEGGEASRGRGRCPSAQPCPSAARLGDAPQAACPLPVCESILSTRPGPGTATFGREQRKPTAAAAPCGCSARALPAQAVNPWTPLRPARRDPRWGRLSETWGEDPLLQSRLAVAFVRGLQGGARPRRVAVGATCKHFLGHDIESFEVGGRAKLDREIRGGWEV